jgi:hypothetical protein
MCPFLVRKMFTEEQTRESRYKTLSKIGGLGLLSGCACLVFKELELGVERNRDLGEPKKNEHLKSNHEYKTVLTLGIDLDPRLVKPLAPVGNR